MMTCECHLCGRRVDLSRSRMIPVPTNEAWPQKGELVCRLCHCRWQARESIVWFKTSIGVVPDVGDYSQEKFWM